MNLFQINILPVIDGDNTLTITTNNVNASTDLFAFLSMELNYGITESSTPGQITLDCRLNEVDAVSDQLIREGQTVNIYAIADGAINLKQIFAGYITKIKYKRSGKGTFAYLFINSILGELSLLSVNTDWNDVSKTYNTIMTNISGGQVSLNPFLNQIAEGSLLSGIPRGSGDSLTSAIDWFTFIDGTAPALPSTLWAVCQTNKSRDSVLREILFPYNRLLWQKEDGTIIIQPLFYDDNADAKWNIDLKNNTNNNWLDWEIEKNAGNMINRIDFQFAAILPFDQYGASYQGGNNIYVSSFANPIYYSRINQLYQSGLFNTVILSNKALDTSIFTDAALYNSLVQANGQSAINNLSANNPVYYSPAPNNKSSSIPQIYASNEMAINNLLAYHLKVTYDYNVMTDETDINPPTQFLDFPLAKVINISSYGLLDYDSMLCFSCQLTIDGAGTNLTAYFVPIESITGIWYNLGGS